MLRSIILALAVLVPTATAYAGDLAWEIDEPNRLERESEGQSNCVAVAAGGIADGPCLREDTARPERADGFRILDAHVTSPGVGEPSGADRVSASRARQQGLSYQRDLGEAGVRLLLPGAAVLRAWYGHWVDENANGVIDVACDVPTATSTTCSTFHAAHEWAPRPGAIVLGYVEPGSHPAATETSPPGAGGPDVRLTYRKDTMDYEQADGTPTLRLDGSLLGAVRILVVTEPLAESSPTATLPFTPTADSRIDIDVHPALAPGPVASLYAATLAPFVNAIGSPSAGVCASRCVVSPALLAGTPVEAEAGVVATATFARDPREWAEGSGASSAGRHADHLAGPAPWLDVLAANGRPGADPFAKSGPLLARPDGALLGGWLAFEIWSGLWWDRDADGFVGASGYASGTRPRPDDYADARGEWLGIVAKRAGGGNVEITLAPRVPWPEGAFLAGPGGGPIPYEIHNVPTGCATLDPPCVRVRDADAWRVTDMEWVTLRVVADASASGRAAASAMLFIPPGSTFAFDLCAENLEIAHTVDGNPTQSAVWDCDVL